MFVPPGAASEIAVVKSNLNTLKEKVCFQLVRNQGLIRSFIILEGYLDLGYTLSVKLFIFK
jgi:hypothetical protein